MAHRGGETPPNTGGELLLSLLRNPSRSRRQQDLHSHSMLQHPQSPALDPAVVAVGAAFPTGSPLPWPSNSPDLPSSCYQSPLSHPPTLPRDFLGIAPYHPSSDLLRGNQMLRPEEAHNFGFPDNANRADRGLVNHQKSPQSETQLKFQFGSFSNDATPIFTGQQPNLNSVRGGTPNLGHQQSFSNYQGRGTGISGSSNRGKQYPNTSICNSAPPGFSNKQRQMDGEFGPSSSSGRRLNRGELTRGAYLEGEDQMLKRLSIGEDDGVSVIHHLDHHETPTGNILNTTRASNIERSLLIRRQKFPEEESAEKTKGNSLNEVEYLLIEDELNEKLDQNEKKTRRNPRERERRIDDRGKCLLSRRLRNLRWKMACRNDINGLNASFLSVFESLIPPAEEQAKQKQLLAMLETLVSKEWPEAKLHLYGSCANSFGFSKSDIDVCLTIEDKDRDKTEMLLKLANILQTVNLQNVQALTRARVPVVKLQDPVTGISCDICINNVLAVVNTKLLRDYAQIDSRLRQLAFIVKHWAKSRGVNETYQGTLSSYAYVLMCIHFLQQRSPPILPCLQGMEPTYVMNVGGIDCSYFDRVEVLCNYGSGNTDSIAELVWGFFNYWAHGHDYANHVVSVRRGGIISKEDKEWTRRVGNDRHLICIEDPFETSHDLGRVVDKFSIKVLRGEFERAAEIMQYHTNPCTKLFEPYDGDH